MISINPDKKEFDKITLRLNTKHYNGLLNYFDSTGVSIQNANKFLKTPKGIAFLAMYAKTEESKATDAVSISKLILEVEREENIISYAIDIVNEH